MQEIQKLLNQAIEKLEEYNTAKPSRENYILLGYLKNMPPSRAMPQMKVVKPRKNTPKPKK